MTTPPLRGKRGAERRLGERVVDDFVRRHRIDAESAVDFDVAEVDREIEDVERTAEADTAETGQLADAARRGTDPRRPRAAGSAARVEPAKGGRRLPDLSALPPLLAATGSFASLRERLGPAVEPATRHGRHAGLTSVPHGAKSYLAATLALATPPERLVWVARDAEIGDRVAEELGAWLGDADAVAVLEPRSSLAYERSELVADETAARVAALAAWRSGRARILVASVQALLQRTLDPADLPSTPRILRPATRIGLDALLRELLDLGYQPTLEVAGRGEFARRGGIVDVFPPGESLPVRIDFFGDEIDSLRRFDPTDQRTVGAIASAALLPASEFLVPSGGVAELRARLGRGAARLPERLAADLARFEGQTADAATAAGDPADRSTRALDAGDAAEVWATIVCPATALDHLDPGTLLVLDEPGDLAEAGSFLWRQADERRADLIAAGDLPKDWPATYLPPRDWKSRLLAARTLELSWESEPGEAIAGGGLSSGDLFGWREPSVPGLRSGRLVEAVESWAEDGVRIVLASDQAARLSELLGEAGRPVAAVSRVDAAPPPGAVALVERSLNGGFIGGPDLIAFVTDRELFGTVRVRRPKAMRRVVPRDILERLTPGDLVVHIDHGIARYEQMLRRGGPGEERDYLELRFGGDDRIYVPVEQIQRVSRYSGGERPDAEPARRDRLAAHEAAGEAGGRRPGRGAPGAVRGPDLRPRSCVRRRYAVAGRDGGELPVRGDRRPAPGRGRDEARHGGGPADGPARRRRRRLRQDRGRDPGRVQGGPGRQAGRGPRPDDGPRRPALPDVRSALRGLPDVGPAAVPVRLGARPGGDDRRPRRAARSTWSSAPTACCRRTSGSATSGWSSSTRSSASASPRRSGSSDCATRSTC